MKLPVLKVFTVTRGVTFDYRLQYLQGVPGTATPQDLSTYTGQMTLTSWDGLTTHLTLSTTNAGPGFTGVFFGGDPNTPTNGIIDLVIDAADAAAITWESARYNFSITNTAVNPNVVTRLLYGSVGVFGFLP